jgi:hypothetical protein
MTPQAEHWLSEAQAELAELRRALLRDDLAAAIDCVFWLVSALDRACAAYAPAQEDR